MKTLDEVIEAQETCLRGACDKCSYDNSNFDICDVKLQSDVLYYLKEYREMKKHLACLDDAEIRGDDTQIINNPPLTWDELKNMEGKPVWIENDYSRFCGWEMVERLGTNKWLTGEIFETSGGFYRKEDQDRTWNAYRKERK